MASSNERMDHLAMANNYDLSADMAQAHALIAIAERLDRLCDLIIRVTTPGDGDGIKVQP